MKNRYMLDSNVFDEFVDGHIDIFLLTGRRILVTHIQMRELKKTGEKNLEKLQRRDALMDVFDAIGPKEVSTYTATWGDTPWGQRWSDTDGVYGEILQRITELDKASKKPSSSLNLSRDARIAETAIKEGAVLVSNDKNLRTVVLERGGEAVSTEIFASRLNN